MLRVSITLFTFTKKGANCLFHSSGSSCRMSKYLTIFVGVTLLPSELTTIINVCCFSIKDYQLSFLHLWKAC